ncbi:MAG: phosphoribosylformylglycinamidine synthase subunit PurL [Asgard group archaeon]|nr:phosphoribosylformylglycinamidine synthase subunit PurL [Asgard group archaeon]
MTEKVAKEELELTRKEKEAVFAEVDRELSVPEAAMLEVMNSEHCSYKSSRPVLKQLPSSGSQVICGPGEDAGVVDIGDGLALVFKLESHNHPSAIDPYNGAATGIGGIIRDILCMGARPIGLLDSFRFGNLSNPHTKWLLKWVTKGVGDYGNCVGIANAGGEIEFDPSFQTNCLINVGCFGVMPKKDLALSRASSPGDKLYLLGGSTGRDGLKGASFASKNITEESESDRGAVQIGDPYLKKLIIEATLEAIQTGIVEGLKDLGAAGITCAISETADAGGTGTEIDLEKVRLREDDMLPWEILVSESQERMFFVVKPQNAKQLEEIFEKYELQYEEIGEVTTTGKCIVHYQGETIVELPAHLLTDPPTANRPAKKPDYIKTLQKDWLPEEPKNLEKICLELLLSDNIISRSWVYRQYDTEVGLYSVIKSGMSDAGVFRLTEFSSNKGVAVTFDGNSRQCYLDPYNAAQGVMMEACSNVAAVGGKPLAMTDCLNFGNPEHPTVFWTFKKAVEGLSKASEALAVPCVGGNVSFYNHDEINDIAVKPSPVVFVAGIIDDVSKAMTQSFKDPDEIILLIGETKAEIGGSEYTRVIHHSNDGQVPTVNYKTAKKTLDTIVSIISQELVTACHDLSKGGLFVALAEMAMSGNCGCEINLEKITEQTGRRDIKLFSESLGRFLITAPKKKEDKILELVREQNIPVTILGKVIKKPQMVIKDKQELILNLFLTPIKKEWENKMLQEMEGTKEEV